MFIVKYGYMAGNNYAGGVAVGERIFEEFIPALKFAVENDGKHGVPAKVMEIEVIFELEGEDLQWHLDQQETYKSLGENI